MELQDYPAARDLGEKSLAAAREAQDQMWQLNASVLVAQAESELTLVLYKPVMRLREGHSSGLP